MKLSEAIRKGARKFPFSVAYFTPSGRCCSNGAAYCAAFGKRPSEVNQRRPVAAPGSPARVLALVPRRPW